jgi:hypothetical protein
MTTWTNPRTWADGEKVSTLLLNPQIRDNLNHLKPRIGYIGTTSLGPYSDSGNWLRPASMKIPTDVGPPHHWMFEIELHIRVDDVVSFFVDFEEPDTPASPSKGGYFCDHPLSSGGTPAWCNSAYAGIQYQIDFTPPGGIYSKVFGVFQDSGTGFGMVPQWLPYTGSDIYIYGGTNIKAWQLD